MEKEERVEGRSELKAHSTDIHERMEELLARALYGEPISTIGSYSSYFLNRNQATVLFVYGNSLCRIHKYVTATDAAEREYVLAMPVEWCSSHKDIASRLKRSCGLALRITGGGFVVAVNTKTIAYGLSCEYGTGDHKKVEEFLSQAIMAQGEEQRCAA